ncbi:HAD family hydrolase [Pararhizobium haloflavum]|uniref:HAD family hydrolase n=1 Tax=Pararhizobium haloflavum TaxID=2037914 RepID=UPI000C19024E|nr:HAD family hydrolase [Pararhizobium haloflavum]
MRSRDAGTGTGLVIFDCDGVLVDSEPISISVLVDLVAEAGHDLSSDDAYDRFLGKSMASICAMLGDDPGIAVTPAHLDAMRLVLYRRFRDELRPIPGVAEALDAIDVPHCVASSSQPERIALSLDVTGLLHRLEPHIFSATMVENGKPAPDLFLYAADKMGISPERCLVIEDSVPGIEAAKSAGMRVFAFTGGSHAAPVGLQSKVAALEPDLIFDNMRELPALLGKE